uniref:HMG box domain-containing protein n=1 Tax=Davidia involucrata TaxID=16924 RepID=A0A5B7CD89_DAVIN
MPRTKYHAATRWQEEVESEQRTMHRGSMSNPGNTEPCIRQTGFKIFYSELVRGLEESAIYNEIKGEMASVAQLVGQMWKDLDHDEKLRFNTRAQQQRQLHREMMPPVEKKAYTPPVFRTKCSPRMVVKLKEDIISQPHKVQLIRSMGFESMLDMSCKTLRLTFVAYVLDRFDPDTQFLQVGVNRVHITAEDVGKFLGIPYAGKSVPSVISIKKMNLLKARFPNRSFAELNRLTVHGQESDEVFMQTYLLYLLGCFLCPTTCDQASPTLLNAISIASKANEYNWGSYVLKWLVQQVKSYKEKHNPGGTGGCLFFLMIFYLYHAASGDVGGDAECATILGWTDELIEKSIDKVMQRRPSAQSGQRFQNPRDLLHSMLIACGSKLSVNEFEIKHHKMLQQALRDLGSSDIFVSKFMKLWDGRMTSPISKEMINVIRH